MGKAFTPCAPKHTTLATHLPATSSMNLFEQLRVLAQREKFPLEDFHTEIVAQVLNDSPALTLAWLRQIGATNLAATDSLRVETQVKLPALAGHATDSRPDMAIRLTYGEHQELIFVESKVGAPEGEGQLQRYAEHLAVAGSEVRRTALVFITRDWEPGRYFSVDPARFRFCQTRWHEFFPLLVTHANGDGLARQLKLFMQEHRMSQRNQFTVIDSLALTNFRVARDLMDETMWGEISQEFSRTIGWVTNRTDAHRELRNGGNYLMYAVFDPGHYLRVELGYWLPEETPTTPVWIGVTILSNPSAPLRKEMVGAMRRFTQKHGKVWESDGLSDDKAKSCIFRGKELPHFMVAEDHVQAIKDYFKEVLADVAEFRAASPELPWSTAGTASASAFEDESVER